MKRLEGLHVWSAIQEHNAFDSFVGMLHLFNRLLAPYLGEYFVAPVVLAEPQIQVCLQLIDLNGTPFCGTRRGKIRLSRRAKKP
jgi:hypothetical protein